MDSNQLTYVSSRDEIFEAGKTMKSGEVLRFYCPSGYAELGIVIEQLLTNWQETQPDKPGTYHCTHKGNGIFVLELN